MTPGLLNNALLAGAFLYILGFAIFYQPVYAPKEKITAVQVDGNLTQLLIKNTQQYSVSLLGRHQQPISLVLVAVNATVIQDAFHKAGWLATDKIDFKNLLRSAEQGMSYTQAPLAPGFWNSRINNYSFIRPQRPGGKKHINSVLIWRSPYKAGDKQIFTAVVRMYDDIHWSLLHNILPDVDTARDLLLASFKQATIIQNSCTLNFINPEAGELFGNQHFFTQGKLLIIAVKHAPDSSTSTKTTDICGHGMSSTK